MVEKKGSTDAAVPQEYINLPVQSASPTPMSIMELAVTQGADVAQLEKLMDLQERWESREAKKAYDAALANFKDQNIKISKDGNVDYPTQGQGGRVQYNFATLNQVLDAITPKLHKQGLALTWRTQQEGSQIKVTAILSHELGHSEETSLTAAPDTSGKKNPIQAVGSTISYLQRYTALSITGVTTAEMDDDGQGSDNVRIIVEDPRQETDRGTGEVPDWEGPAAKSYFEKCIEYVDNFANGTLQEWNALKDSGRIEQAKANMTKEEQVKFDSTVRSIRSIFEEGGNNDS